MKQFEAKLAWERGGQTFTDQRYSRAHEWTFDGGLTVPASSSPLSVPLPMSDAAAVDPEEALVAATSSCHMLFFLSIAAQRGYVVDSYRDRLEAKGMWFAGMSPDGVLPETVELRGHPFFIGVQYHPELKSRPFEPHPLFAGFIAAAVEQSRLV